MKKVFHFNAPREKYHRDGGDAVAEATHHERELKRAAVNLREAIPGIEVQGYFVDFDGIWDAEIAGAPEIRVPTVA